MQLTPRDVEIVLLVYSFSGVAIYHLLQAFWEQKADLKVGARNAVYRRVNKLIEAGYLQSDRLPSVTGYGGGRLFLTLGTRGKDLVAEHLGLSRSELKPLRHIETPYTAAHHLAICDFRLALTLAVERSGLVDLTSWVPERELRTPPIVRIADPKPAPGASTSPLIPLISDGEFTLRFLGIGEQSYRLEIDMGTIPVKRMCAKIRGYLAYFDHDDRPVLWVVPDPRRQQAVLRWCHQEAEDLNADPTIFWATHRWAKSASAEPPSDMVTEQTILTPIWQVVDGPILALVPTALTS